MSRPEPELRAALENARQMGHGEAQQALMEDVIRHADAGGFPRLAFSARRSLANAYSVDRQWDKAFPLFSRCLSEHDQRPEDFGPEEDWSLRRWYTSITQSMSEFPEISLAQIYGACDDMERRFKAGGHSLRKVYAARRWIAQLACDWDEEERCYQAWITAGGPQHGSVWDFEEEVERLVLRGDDASVARALELAEPVLSGDVGFTEPAAPIQCRMLLPLARAGRHEEAALAYKRADRVLEHGVYRYEYRSMQIEFCALTGNEDTGLRLVKERIHGWYSLNRPSGKMEFSVAAALLLGRMAAVGRGAEQVTCHCNEHPPVPATVLRDQMTRTALELAAQFDARNGTTAQGDRIRAMLAQRPVADFLPLTPTSRKPVRAAATEGLAPEQLLDRAEWHQRCQEDDTARAYLSAVPEPPPPHLAGRVVELRALLDWGPGTEAALRWAAEAHRHNGDTRRSLLCLCWLGRWLTEENRGKEGMAMVNKAVRDLRAADDSWAAAWGELRLAQVLVLLQKPGEYYAIQRAGALAAASGDPLVLGMIAADEASWLKQDGADPARVIRLATTALDALITAGAAEKAVIALDHLRTAYERAGADADFVTMVRARLAAPRPGTPAGVHARLRYEHGRALLGEGRPEEAVTDLTEAVGQAHALGLDRAEQWYFLAVACHSTGRFEEAVHAAAEGANWLAHLRRNEWLDHPVLADHCRMILADSHHEIGETEAALEQYVRLVEDAGEVGNAPVVAVGQGKVGVVLAELGRYADSAAMYREAAQGFWALGDVPTAVRSRCGEAASWLRARDPQSALAAVGLAQQAVPAIPAHLAEERAALQQEVAELHAAITGSFDGANPRGRA
ncbi:hypothetical protein CLV63_12819 [Murinocardiopsis flavida]|uniref:Tetratricopeptide repeat protein n=1 Tax=Murinocardiopsis flavida TaxID=645275 RepID=A0A2P8CVC6_9ACTN|nr:hypothetical protein [Murinocardiopsis flavida]PSK88931.1 hypothetical protein CLV63_12819 [Murinocardiopsis flavida]